MSSMPARWTAVLCLCAFAFPAWACFPSPDAKPKHEISVLDLPQQLPGIVVAFESEGFALKADASDLLAELSQAHRSVASPNDLANALRSKMSLGQEIGADELVAVLISNAKGAPDDGRSDPRWIAAQANASFRFAFAKLLEESKVSVTEISSQRVLPQIELDRFSEICHGGRVFMSPDKKIILRVMDWIS